VDAQENPAAGQTRTAAAADELTAAEAVRLTSDLIRMDTTNRGAGDCCERPAAEYAAARLAEAGLQPVLLEPARGRANVVARVSGTDQAAPALLVHGHLDVVPADAAAWAVHPLSGEVRDGVVWGRGAVDMKNSVAMVLAVVRAWARSGARPHRDIVLAFTADEEDTAAYGAAWLADKHAGLFEGCTEAIGESGAFTFHAAPGLRLYPLASAERGTAWLRLTAHGTPGHGSRRSPNNALIRLADAITRLGSYSWPVRLIPTVRASLAAIAECVGVQYDLDSPEPDVDLLLAKLGPAAALVAATVRNSANPTMLRAGDKVNVIPGDAVACVDGRVLPGYGDEFRATLDELTGPNVSWEYLHRETALEAPLSSPTTAAMTAALLAEDPQAHVVPYCMGGGTDAKQFARLGIAGYGFMPLELPPGYDYHAMFHGVDERVPVSALGFGVRVLSRFLTSVR
jgi:acetylornithine deacetylase/succinyl-diaminopimelate desuccinylase-like protein